MDAENADHYNKKLLECDYNQRLWRFFMTNNSCQEGEPGVKKIITNTLRFSVFFDKRKDKLRLPFQWMLNSIYHTLWSRHWNLICIWSVLLFLICFDTKNVSPSSLGQTESKSLRGLTSRKTTASWNNNETNFVTPHYKIPFCKCPKEHFSLDQKTVS